MNSQLEGPWDVAFGENGAKAIEGIDVSYDVDSGKKKSIQGHSRTVYGSHDVSVKFTLLDSDVPAIAVFLPQYIVPQGGELSSGETVTAEEGAFDLVPGGCDTAPLLEDLVMQSCGEDGTVIRFRQCKAEFTGIKIEEKIANVEITLTGESDDATLQMFRKGGISALS